MFNLKLLQKNKTVKYGIPMLLLVVGGSFGLREFTQIRYDSQKIRKRLDPSLEAKVNIQRQPVILEEEYEKLKEMNLDEWKNIRGPRPWEDSREYQEQQRRKLSNKD
ncbi:cytochrome c oxidase assembly protein COX16 homolog, mitochondrial [Maylandia zebra]|uniref:Cytochrome c oxidase assembly protein COX16 homolog, mitochondrial n=4 Tax=Haplochromini TaxID=319058 RepID=A0A3B4H3T4_9CICH|nr:PREDICTED: cytochrome c oxidase assembly protein COX16 homolog, mitochondrial [Pundamilia nyererei]XP_005934059.1 cytochrome c oxidase assembly protein COX16 homolog, mitochondrial [Haplochromis burtoni]XP_012776990.1 cytochrome c oxidase assembly protein COX16 homolog, mitochondrial [Maylandia zebra]XP_026007171.1 cytochrome c oxidase assembly protein COX16 homolog, mitochondrial [Astatotilapia calliptera]XP_039898723.1 cytochrome c oxidase assembly protein COX16 homolog, mitochondrial [Sim